MAANRIPMKNLLKHAWWIAIIIFIAILFILAKTNRRESIGMQFPDQGNQHVESVDSPHEPYNSRPPTSGPHVGRIAPWGVSAAAIPNELQVHNLEDGGVLIQYHPDKASKEDIAELEKLADEYRGRHIVVAPYADMEYKIAFTAWTRLLPLESADKEQIKKFIRAYEGIDHHKR